MELGIEFSWQSFLPTLECYLFYLFAVSIDRKTMNTPNINQLFQNAQSEGTISNSAFQALTVIDIGAQIQAGLGISVDDVMASEVVLVTIMPDDSASIDYGSNAQGGERWDTMRCWMHSKIVSKEMQFSFTLAI
jgi:hypothetical protein